MRNMEVIVQHRRKDASHVKRCEATNHHLPTFIQELEQLCPTAFVLKTL